MSLNCLVTSWKPALPCLLALLITTSAIAAEPSSVSQSTPGRPTATKAPDDPFVGDYSGDIHPLGVYEGKRKPKDDKDYKPTNCGTCHAEAKVERSGTGYSLTMLVDHGKDKEGKPRRDRITLKTERREKPLAFVDDAYSITVADGETTNGWIKQMAAEIKLKRKTEVAAKPANAKSAP